MRELENEKDDDEEELIDSRDVSDSFDDERDMWIYFFFFFFFTENVESNYLSYIIAFHLPYLL